MTGIELLGSALGLATKLLSLKSASERQACLIELQQILVAANSAALSLQNQNAALLHDKQELEKEVVRLKDWSEDRENYELREIGPGAFAFVSKTSVQPMTKAEKLCATCFRKGEYAILQLEQKYPTVIMNCGGPCKPFKFHYLYN
jgi:hypothetical protein